MASPHMKILGSAVKGSMLMAAPLVKALALSAGIGGVGYLVSKQEQKRIATDIGNSMLATYKMYPEFSKDPDLFSQRFGELSAIAPTIAANPQMASKVLKEKLKAGFMVDDIHKLTMIQAHTSKTPGTSASSAARVAALTAFDRLSGIIGPEYYRDYIQNRRQLLDWRAEADKTFKEIRKSREMSKTSMERTDIMEQKISDECIGEMLADRFCIVKTAGLGGYLVGASKNLARGAAIMAPVIALSGAAAIAGSVIDAMKARKMEEEAEAAFIKIKKDSDVIRGNPHLAAEAFDAIKSFAPALATKPQVLKTFIEHTIRTEQIAPQTVGDLASAQANVNKSRELGGFAAGISNALKVPISIGESAAGATKGIRALK